MILKRFRLQNDDAGASGGGAAPAPAPAAPTPAPAAPAPSPASAPTPAPSAGEPAPSALSGAAPPPAAPEWKPENIPEKYRVTGADGQIDQPATLAKVEQARSELEKRMGAGGAPPKSADEYKIDSEPFQKLGLDAEGTKDWRNAAHKLGLSQAQMEGVTAFYGEFAPQVAGAGAELSAEQTTAALKAVWPDPAAYTANSTAAYKAANALATKAGIPFEEVDKAIGNNPAAIRLLAALGDELGEDFTPPSTGGTAAGPQANNVQQYLGTADNWKAYSDQHHIRHAEVSAQVRKLSENASKRL